MRMSGKLSVAGGLGHPPPTWSPLYQAYLAWQFLPRASCSREGHPALATRALCRGLQSDAVGRGDVAEENRASPGTVTGHGASPLSYASGTTYVSPIAINLYIPLTYFHTCTRLQAE